MKKEKKNLRLQSLASLLLVMRRLCKTPPKKFRLGLFLLFERRGGQKKETVIFLPETRAPYSPLRRVRSGTFDSTTVGASDCSTGKAPSSSATIGQRGFQGTNGKANELSHPSLEGGAEWLVG